MGKSTYGNLGAPLLPPDDGGDDDVDDDDDASDCPTGRNIDLKFQVTSKY